jgi:hypothetical protein
MWNFKVFLKTAIGACILLSIVPNYLCVPVEEDLALTLDEKNALDEVT